MPAPAAAEPATQGHEDCIDERRAGAHVGDEGVSDPTQDCESGDTSDEDDVGNESGRGSPSPVSEDHNASLEDGLESERPETSESDEDSNADADSTSSDDEDSTDEETQADKDFMRSLRVDEEPDFVPDPDLPALVPGNSTYNGRVPGRPRTLPGAESEKSHEAQNDLAELAEVEGFFDVPGNPQPEHDFQEDLSPMTFMRDAVAAGIFDDKKTVEKMALVVQKLSYESDVLSYLDEKNGKTERENIAKKLQSVTLEDHVPDRPYFYWLYKAAHCEQLTREKIVSEITKNKRARYKIRRDRRGPVHECFTYKPVRPFVWQYKFADGTEVEPPKPAPDGGLEGSDAPVEGGPEESVAAESDSLERDIAISASADEAKLDDEDQNPTGPETEQENPYPDEVTESNPEADFADEATESNPGDKQKNKKASKLESAGSTKPLEFAVTKPRRQHDRSWIFVIPEDDLAYAFFEAAKTGSERTVLSLKMRLCHRDFRIHGGEIDLYRDRRGRSALHYTAMSGNEQAVDALQELVNTQDHDGWTPLHTAAWFGNRICCDKIVKYGADVDIRCYDGRKAIEYARENKWRSTVQTLVRFGLDEPPKTRAGKKKKSEAEKHADLLRKLAKKEAKAEKARLKKARQRQAAEAAARAAAVLGVEDETALEKDGTEKVAATLPEDASDVPQSPSDIQTRDIEVTAPATDAEQSDEECPDPQSSSKDSAPATSSEGSDSSASSDAGSVPSASSDGSAPVSSEESAPPASSEGSAPSSASSEGSFPSAESDEEVANVDHSGADAVSDSQAIPASADGASTELTEQCAAAPSADSPSLKGSHFGMYLQHLANTGVSNEVIAQKKSLCKAKAAHKSKLIDQMKGKGVASKAKGPVRFSPGKSVDGSSCMTEGPGWEIGPEGIDPATTTKGTKGQKAALMMMKGKKAALLFKGKGKGCMPETFGKDLPGFGKAQCPATVSDEGDAAEDELDPAEFAKPDPTQQDVSRERHSFTAEQTVEHGATGEPSEPLLLPIPSASSPANEDEGLSESPASKEHKKEMRAEDVDDGEAKSTTAAQRMQLTEEALQQHQEQQLPQTRAYLRKRMAQAQQLHPDQHMALSQHHPFEEQLAQLSAQGQNSSQQESVSSQQDLSRQGSDFVPGAQKPAWAWAAKNLNAYGKGMKMQQIFKGAQQKGKMIALQQAMSKKMQKGQLQYQTDAIGQQSSTEPLVGESKSSASFLSQKGTAASSRPAAVQQPAAPKSGLAMARRQPPPVSSLSLTSVRTLAGPAPPGGPGGPCDELRPRELFPPIRNELSQTMNGAAAEKSQRTGQGICSSNRIAPKVKAPPPNMDRNIDETPVKTHHPSCVTTSQPRQTTYPGASSSDVSPSAADANAIVKATTSSDA
ncbi:unnamed protein product [Amoebophrya sp. A120]|nr:unnamed protein product [Amoebophrya sp. A120]|eukprot:GSA120T00001848001.1